MYLADSLAFLGQPGKPPIAHSGLGLDLVHVTSAPPWFTDVEEILTAHKGFRQSVSEQPSLFPVLDPSDLERSCGTGIVFGLQSPPYEAGEQEVSRLRESGIRVVQIAYQGKNPYGGGFLEPTTSLSLAGERFISFCQEQGILVDLSHAGHETARAITKMGKGGIFVSHTGCWEVYQGYSNPHPTAGYRNLPDNILQEVVGLGGVIGIYTLTFGLHPESNTPEPFFDHLSHAIALCGEDAITIGSDGVYQEQNLSELENQFQFMKEKLDPDGLIGARFPDQPEELNSPLRLEYLFREISLRFSPSVAEKVCGENLRRFFSENL